jgi:hypothetical protein
MSGAIGASNYGLMTSLMWNTGQTSQQLDKLTTEVSTGLVASSYDGLGSGASVPLTLDPQVANLNHLAEQHLRRQRCAADDADGDDGAPADRAKLLRRGAEPEFT